MWIFKFFTHTSVQFWVNIRAMKFICAFVTLFQLASSLLDDTCGEARVVQVSDRTRNVSTLHFPWAGALYSVVNKTITGDIKYICGASLVSESYSVTGKGDDNVKRFSLWIFKFQPATAFMTNTQTAIVVHLVKSFYILEFTTCDKEAQQVSRLKKYFCTRTGIHLQRATMLISPF